MRNVADTGLDILYTLLQNVANHEEAAQSFYQTYFTDILQHVFSVVTDSSHTAGTRSHLLLVYGREYEFSLLIDDIMLFYCMNLWLLMFQSNFVYRVSILYMNHEAIHIVTFIDMILQYCTPVGSMYQC